MGWRKSTYSNANGGDCVEVASAGGVAVRDTTDREGVTLEFSAEAWQQFTRRLRGLAFADRLLVLRGQGSFSMPRRDGGTVEE
jgi:hypothetical protein